MSSNTKPHYIFFLVFPAGISQGFVTVALPYLLVHHGFSVAASASVIAVGFSANIWRFVWGPIVDISLSLKKWYWIGMAAFMGSLLLLCITPLTTKGQVYLTVIVFISQVAATFTLLPVAGIMAKQIENAKQGSASGWYQAGSLVGVGVGGGAGLWITTHYSVFTAGAVLCVMAVLFALVIILIQDVHYTKGRSLWQQLAGMGKDIVVMVKIPVALFAILMIIMPIGSGALTNIWSSIGKDWNTGPDTVALVTGIFSGIVSAVGCVAGGFIVDRKGIWFGYLVSGTVCAVITVLIAAMPYIPAVYVAGVLAYTFGVGLINAAFTSVILFAIGKTNVATKFSLLASLGNIPVVYMTAFDGWAHDAFNNRLMLVAEAVLGFIFILICLVVINRLRAKKLLLKTIDY